MQETIIVRTWAPDRRKRTDGSAALRERNLRIMSARILPQEQWPRWRHCRTITYVIRVDLLEFSSAAAPLSSLLPFAPGCHRRRPRGHPFFHLNSPRSVCWYHCHRVRGAGSLKLERGNTIWSGGINFAPKLGRNYLRAGGSLFCGGAESQRHVRRPGKAVARHTGELPLIPRLRRRDPYC